MTVIKYRVNTALTLQAWDGGTATPTIYRLNPAPADYDNSATTEAHGTDYRLSSFAEITLEVKGTYLDSLNVTTWQDASRFQVKVNGGAWSPVSMAPNETATKRTTLPATGTKIVKVRLPPEHRVDDQGEIWYGWIRQFASDGPIRVIAPVKPTNERILVVGDSISNNGTPSTDLLGWTMRFRDDTGRNLVVQGWGGRSLTNSLGSPEARQLEADRDVAYLTGADIMRFYLALAANDRGYDPATVAAIAADLLDRVHQGNSAIQMYFEMPILRFTNSSRTTVDTGTQAFVDAFVAIASARPWLTIVHAESWLTTADQYQDGVHPNDAGHAEKKRRFLGVMNGEPQTPTTPSVALTVSPLTAPAGTSRSFASAISNIPGASLVNLYDDTTKQIVASSSTSPFTISFAPTDARGYFTGVNKPGGGFYYSNVVQVAVGTNADPTATLTITPQTALAGSQRTFSTAFTNLPNVSEVLLFDDVTKQQVGRSITPPFDIDFTPTQTRGYFSAGNKPDGGRANSAAVIATVNQADAVAVFSPTTTNRGTQTSVTVTLNNFNGTVTLAQVFRNIQPGVSAEQVAFTSTAPYSMTFIPKFSGEYFYRFTTSTQGQFLYSQVVYLTVVDPVVPFTITPQEAAVGVTRRVSIPDLSALPAGTTSVRLWKDNGNGSNSTIAEATTSPYIIDFTPTESGLYFLQFVNPNTGGYTDAIQVLVTY